MKRLRIFIASLALLVGTTMVSIASSRFYAGCIYISSSSIAPTPTNSIALTGYCSIVGFTTIGTHQIQFITSASPAVRYAYSFDGTTFIRLYAAPGW